jgi:hypothetical protein
MIENDSQLLSYKVLFSYFQKIYSQTLVLFLLCKQSPFCQVHNVLLENLILFSEPVSYYPTLILEFLEKFTNWFEVFWTTNAKVMNK